MIKLKLPGPRTLNAIGVMMTAGLMAYALYAQHVLLLDPCPLCVFQRIAVIALGIVFLLAAVQNPAAFGRIVYAAIVGLVALLGAAVAGWHIRLQNLPADQVPSCGPGFDYIVGNFPLGDALALIFKGSGECAEVSWRFLGLSMPAWVLISLLALGAAGIWNNLRSSQ